MSQTAAPTAGDVSKPKSNSKKRWFLNQSKRFKVLLGLVLICIIIAMVLLVRLLIYDHSKVNDAKIQALLKGPNCSAYAIKSVSNEKPNHKQIAASVDLLRYRTFCDSTNSLTLLNQLKSYYVLDGKQAEANSVQSKISRIQEAQKIMQQVQAMSAANKKSGEQ